MCPSVSGLAWADLALKAASLIAAIVSVTLIYRQIKRTHEWNRRKASLDIALEIVTGARAEYTKTLKARFGVSFSEPSKNEFTAVKERLTDAAERGEFVSTVRALLNFNETIALALKNHVFDEDMCYEHYSLILSTMWTWAQPHIREVRAVDPTIWIEQEHYAKKWLARSNREVESLRTPGKTPT